MFCRKCVALLAAEFHGIQDLLEARMLVDVGHQRVDAQPSGQFSFWHTCLIIDISISDYIKGRSCLSISLCGAPTTYHRYRGRLIKETNRYYGFSRVH